MFRGQDDAGYHLVPSAFRPQRKDTLYFEYFHRLKRKYSSLTTRQWCDWAFPGKPAEKRHADAARLALVHGAMIRDFFLIADRTGHRTQRSAYLWHLEGSEGKTDSLSRIVNGELEQFEMEEAAIAQHHKVPTQLLDWTYNPLVAAYFASNPVMKYVKDSTKGEIAVWALHTAIFRRDWKQLRRVTVPPTVVPFLDAQEGLFTWSPEAFLRYGATGAFAMVEDLVAEIGADPRCPTDWKRPLLRRLSLPKREVPALLRLLWREGISVAHLMPTWDNIETSLRARSFLREGAPRKP